MTDQENPPLLGEIGYLQYTCVRFPVIFGREGWAFLKRPEEIDPAMIIRDEVCKNPRREGRYQAQLSISETTLKLTQDLFELARKYSQLRDAIQNAIFELNDGHAILQEIDNSRRHVPLSLRPRIPSLEEQLLNCNGRAKKALQEALNV